MENTVLCKVCGHYKYYESTEVFVDGDKFCVYCDHCMNTIEIGDAK